MANLISFLQYIGLMPKNRKNTKNLPTGVRTSIIKIHQDIKQIEVFSPIELDELGNPIDDPKSPCFHPFISETEIK
ncbi:hypothetical protein [Maribacter sp. 4G9]|uniref:hypothetical protein n=1 Tax=Maribacter sp. 4G9 TaxID=1889777 RepID=UPI000F4D4897|nr:hypothetical protein [Maribacter sp. 4G9]|tara:strand:+ start:349 stop:576 length:228 start_codon:yes stop_codon:yes gene_type:complete